MTLRLLLLLAPQSLPRHRRRATCGRALPLCMLHRMLCCMPDDNGVCGCGQVCCRGQHRLGMRQGFGLKAMRHAATVTTLYRLRGALRRGKSYMHYGCL
jgi:hypothetical protein